MIMAEMEKHPDSYMNDGNFLNKLLIPVSDGYLNVLLCTFLKEHRITLEPIKLKKKKKKKNQAMNAVSQQ